jgi:predicted dehydrogenase
MTHALRLAAIGAGGIAGRHLEALARVGGAVPVGHVARTRASAERQAARFGGRAYDDLDTLLATERPDVALITVPPGAHGAIEEALLDHGVPFLVDKPVAADLATAERIARRVAASGLPVAVGYHWRAMDTIPELAARLADRPPRLVTAAWHADTPPPRWWHRRATGGGQMIEQATHLVDIARHLLGDPALLHATEHPRPPTGVPDADVAVASAATVAWPDGAIGTFTATCALAGAAEVHVTFACDGLHVVLDQAGVRYDDGREVRTVRAAADPFETQLRAFLEAVRGGDPTGVVCSYADALATQRLTCAMAEAAGT